jgi:hypothetical protein
MIACASAPARNAPVTNPDRIECPRDNATCAGVYPAAAARRLIIAATASPDIASTPIAPVRCTDRKNGRLSPPGSSISSRVASRQTRPSPPTPLVAAAVAVVLVVVW